MDDKQNQVTAATDPKPTPKGMGKEEGASGTVIFQGIISNEEYNSNLRGKNLIRKCEIMRRSDATIRATLQVVKLPILSTEWTIEPASDEAADIDIADFVEREVFGRNLQFGDFQRQGLTMFDFGFSTFEKTYGPTDWNGQFRIGIESVNFRKQNSILKWETKEHNPGVTQQLVHETISIPQEKILQFVNDKEGDNVEGISLLRFCYKHWDIKDKLDIVNAMALERHAMGVPVLKKPLGADPGDVADAHTSLRQLRANEESYVDIPIGWDLEMLDMKSQSTKDVIPTIEYHDRQITLSVLAQFLMLGASGGSGSRAVSKDHSELFMSSEDAAARNVQTTIQNQLIEQLCDLNFSNLPNGYPQLKYSKIANDDVTAMADAIQKYMTAGALTADPDLEEWVRNGLHAPALPDELRDGYIERKQASAAIAQQTAKEGDIPTDPKKQPPGKAEAMRAARRAKHDLIDIINRD